MESKNELLAKLSELGVLPSGRKQRSDVGKTRVITKTRADKGSKRESYSSNTAAYARRQVQAFLRTHRDQNGEGDMLIRDANMIFPPNVTNFFKVITVQPKTYIDKRTNAMIQTSKRKYTVSRAREHHPEELMWRWYHLEYDEEFKRNPLQNFWANKIVERYFIKYDELSFWTYQEWAWAYVNAIGGHQNINVDNPIILSYDAFLRGDYTIPNFDIDGKIIWNK